MISCLLSSPLADEKCAKDLDNIVHQLDLEDTENIKQEYVQISTIQEVCSRIDHLLITFQYTEEGKYQSILYCFHFLAIKN